jgi:hypothetical protein
LVKVWLTANDDIGSETEEHEDDMGDGTPSSFDDFQETELVSNESCPRRTEGVRMAVGRVHFELGSDHGE